MSTLSFISDEKLEEFVGRVVALAERKAEQAEKDLYKNVIDPFSAVFDSMRQGVSSEVWLEQEKSRQIQKTLQNAVGAFHQNILGAMPGWENLEKGGGLDIVNHEKKLVAEIKNKHNTMNSGSSVAVYEKIENFLRYKTEYKGYTAYCVQIVPKSHLKIDVQFYPSKDGTPLAKRDDIRIIDGASFYDLASGEDGTLLRLYECLPGVIAKINGMKLDEQIKSPMFEDLFRRAYFPKQNKITIA